MYTCLHTFCMYTYMYIILVSGVQKKCVPVKILQHTATHSNTQQYTSTHCNTPAHGDAGTFYWRGANATHCNTLQHAATHCNTL